MRASLFLSCLLLTAALGGCSGGGTPTDGTFTVEDLGEWTTETTVSVSGTATPGTVVEVRVGAESRGTALVASDGTFSLEIVVDENAATVFTVVEISADGESDPIEVTLTHDGIAPGVPDVDPLPSPTGAVRVTVSGSAEPGAAITIEGGAQSVSATADELGAFSVAVDLTEDAENTLQITATDAAGNASDAATLAISQDSSLPVPVDLDPLPTVTSDAVVTLSGSGEPNATYLVTGGAESITIMTDDAGAFSNAFTLRANEENTISLNEVGGDPLAVATVVHDDIAPDAPTLDPVASPTAETTVTVPGSTEPFAMVTLTGGEEDVSGMADASGRFALDVIIAADTSTTLEVSATDAAGNAGEATTLMVTHSSSARSAPTLDDPSPAPTGELTYTVSGVVPEPGASITVSIRGAVSDVTGIATDPTSGAFSAQVELADNATTNLEVFAIDGAIESSPALVSVTHDDTAPDAPNAEAITVATPTSPIGCIRQNLNVSGTAGAVEAFGSVTLVNDTQGSAMGAASANSEGAFSGTILACAGDSILVSVADAVGNESESTTVVVPTP